MNLFINLLFTNPEEFFAKVLMIVFSICCHEYSHAWTALRQGDPTAAEQGHLTLSPFKQMGVTSLIMLAFIGLAWGQVPVNPQRMKHRYSEALVAFAGPAMNLILFFGFCLLASIIHLVGVQKDAVNLIIYGGGINMVLFIVNMLPIPTLDGWTVFRNLFPKIKFEQSEFMKGAMVLVFIMVILFFNYLYAAGMFAASIVASILASLLNATGMF